MSVLAVAHSVTCVTVMCAGCESDDTWNEIANARTLVMLSWWCLVWVARAPSPCMRGRLRAPRWVGVRAACRSVFRLLFCARAGVSVASAPLRPSQSWVLMFLWR